MMQRVSAGLRRMPMRSAVVRRELAIPATVKTATDTSEMEFPAPSHVNVASDAAAIARQFREFYSNKDSTVKLGEAAKEALTAEITKKVTAIPEGELDELYVKSKLSVPDEIRLGDNPNFGK